MVPFTIPTAGPRFTSLPSSYLASLPSLLYTLHAETQAPLTVHISSRNLPD